MAVPHITTQSSQYLTQTTYQSHIPQQQYQYPYQPSQYQQPSPYAQDQQPYPHHSQLYQPVPVQPMMAHQQMIHGGRQLANQSPPSYGHATQQSPNTSDDAAPVRVEDEETFRNENPVPSPEIHAYDGKVWKLQVVQEPSRARMCGYGDKDRRPITSPPIVQLIITDAQSGNEMDYDDGSLTISHFTCLVQLGGLQKNEDKSVLKGHPQQQIISACTIGGYPAAIVPQSPDRVAPRVEPGQYPAMPYGQSGYLSNRTTSQSRFPPMDRAPPWNGQHSSMSGPTPTPYGPAPPRLGLQLPALPAHHPAGMRPQQPPTPPADSPSSVNAGTAFARNLIGSTSSSAHLLQDLTHKRGIYFIFPDLSVRTEDWFRLKFQVFNVAECLNNLSQEEIIRKAASNDAAPSAHSDGKRGSKNLEGIKNSLVGKTAPCLATCWSQCFRVYSAKKFPGVVDSTELSKTFAEQGVKISVRKDNEKNEKSTGEKRKHDGDDDGEEYDGGLED